MKHFSLYRITVIVFMVIKFLLQHYFLSRLQRSRADLHEEKREELLIKQAREYREKATRLQGLMIKVGQFLSTRADMFPKVFLDELEGLVDQVPPVPSELSMKVLEEQWGGDIYGYISEITEKPVASASIGEVYKAKLLTGETVAIKVQRYQIDKIIRTDFKALRIVLWIFKTFTKSGKNSNLKELTRELITTIGDELNYEKELKNGEYFYKRYKDHDNIIIPLFYEDLSTRKVLVMEWMEGAKITDVNFMNKHQLDRKQIADSLFKFFIEQTLDSGTFHADPHPGNILINKKGDLIIIDFGMVGQIKKSDEIQLKAMLQGFLTRDYELIINQLESLGFLLPHADKQYLQKILRQYFEAYISGEISALDTDLMESVMLDIQDLVQKEPIQLPSEYAFLGRAIIIAIGVLAIIDPNIDLIDHYRPVFQEWLDKDEKGEKSSFSTQVLKDAAMPLLSLPRNVGEWLEAPKLEIRSKEERQWHSFNHQRILLGFTMTTLISIISIVFLLLSILEEHFVLLIVASSATILSIGISINLYIRHRRWVEKEKINK